MTKALFCPQCRGELDSEGWCSRYCLSTDNQEPTYDLFPQEPDEEKVIGFWTGEQEAFEKMFSRLEKISNYVSYFENNFDTLFRILFFVSRFRFPTLFLIIVLSAVNNLSGLT